MNLILISKAQVEDLPIAKNTAYKWHSLRKYPQLIYKVAGKLFFDQEEWERMALAAQERTSRESDHIRRGI